MRPYVLVIVYASSDEVRELVSRHLTQDICLWILPDIVISWRGRQEIERRLLSAKNELISVMERGFEGEFAYAILELNEDQYKAIRPLIVRKLEEEAQRMINWGEALLHRIRSSKSKPERVKKEFTRFDRRYRHLTMLFEVFDVKHEILNKLSDLAREVRIEYERRFG